MEPILIWIKREAVLAFCDYGNDTLGSIKEFEMTV
jgi:hypothetical protein